MKKRRTQKPGERPSAVGYPSWEERPRPHPDDPSRRRFLARLAWGTGGASLLAQLGLPRLAHGQSLEVDFGLLDAHPGRDALMPPAVPAAPPAPPSATPAPVAAAPPAQAPADASSPAGEGEGGGTNEGEVGQGLTVTENRALWVEPGYLILLRWTRPRSDDDPVAALEGATDAVAGFLGTEVTSSDDLHNLDRLHEIEHGVVELLEPRVVPAVIETLHLDHDCNSVCSQLDLGPDPDVIPLPGVPVAPDW